MGNPQISRIIIQPEEFPDVFRITYPLKSGHILSAGSYISSADTGINIHYRTENKFSRIYFFLEQASLLGLGKVAPYYGGMVNTGLSPNRHRTLQVYIKVVVQMVFTLFPGLLVIIIYMQGIVPGVLRINPIGSEAASQSVGALMHISNAGYNTMAVKASAGAV
jgi:hypothetical protein